MSKAIAGAAMLAGAAAIFIFAPELAPFIAPELLNSLFFAVAASGLSMEAGAIAGALTSNRAMDISTRQAAGMRQIVYGQQRIGGTVIYQSTTGSPGNVGNYVYNYVICLAAHQIDSIVNLYLDGRQVFWKQQVSPNGWRANVGCGTVAVPPTATATISGGIITGITAHGGSGFAGVKPMDGYRVKITGGGGSGATAWATNAGSPTLPSWSVTMTNGGSGYTSQPNIDIQGAYTFGGVGAADQQDPAQYGYGLGYGIGPGGPHYNFSNKVFCEARFGDQISTNPMASLTAYDPTWSSVAGNGQATGVAGVNPVTQKVMGVTITKRGIYTSTPTVSFYGGGGGGAAGHCVMSGNQVGNVVMDSNGSGYTSVPSVSFDGGGPANSEQSPYVGGCAYLYLNVGYDPTIFPNAPEIKVTINGKDTIYDPRTGQIGYSQNWALQVADVITDPVYGLGDNTVNQAQLIAAANVCDATIMTSQGAEPTYQQHIHYDTSTAPGDALSLMMSSAAGRLSRIGGQWYVFPAYWQGPAFTMGQSSLIDKISWSPNRSFKDLINCVNGTYIAPNYPYAVSGNYFDQNGFYYGETNNLWPFAWQPTNFPQYAVDALHGYGSSIYLAQDGGVVLPRELTLRGVISVTQAQRVAKINLMRNRQQGSGVFEMNLAAWQMQPLDVMSFSMPSMNWTNKNLEIDKIQLKAEPVKGENGEDGAMALSCSVSVQETDPSVYAWSIGEELTPYDVEAAPGSSIGTPAVPTSLTLTDDAQTALVLSDGTSVSRVLATWVPPADTYVNVGGSIQIQYQFYDTTGNVGPIRVVPRAFGISVTIGGVPTTIYPTNWVDAGLVSGSATYFYIDIPQGYTNVAIQIRSIRANGATSAWVQDGASLISNPHFIGRPVPLLGGGNSTITYPDGTTIQAWKPAQAGADITGSNTAHDTSNVNGTASSTVSLATTGQQRNLVPDSDFKFGNTYWNPVSGAYFAIQNGKGADGGNALAFLGQGTATTVSAYWLSAPFPVTPGQVLTLSSYIDATAGSYGLTAIVLGIVNPATLTGGALLYPVAGTKGRMSASYTIPAGLTSAVVILDVHNGVTIPVGSAAYFSNPQVEVGSVATAYKANVLDDSTGYMKAGSSQIDLSSGIHLNKTIDNIGDGSTYARVAATHVVGGVPAYSGGTLIDNLKPAQPGADVTAQNANVLLQNPNFANGSVGWSLQSGWSVIPGTPCVPGSSNVAQWYSATGFTSAISNNQNIPCAPGNVISASCWLNGSSATAGAVCIRINFWNASGLIVNDQPATIPFGSNWLQSRLVATAPATSTYATIDFAIYGGVGTWYLCGFSASILASSQDEVPDGTTYLRVPRTVFGSSGNAIDASGNLKLKNTKRQNGVTANPSLASSYADLPELGSGNSAMTIALNGNPIEIGANLAFTSITGSSGFVTGIAYTPVAFSVSNGSGPPTIAISITGGGGTGATASVGWSASGTYPNFLWTPSLGVSPGSGYTSAPTASVTVTNANGPYSNGTNNYSCTIGSGTPTPNVGAAIQVQVKMDGVTVFGPFSLATDTNGNATYTGSMLITPAPSAGSHTFQVQGMTNSGKTITSTTRAFQLVELG